MQNNSRVWDTLRCILVVVACGFAFTGCSPKDGDSAVRKEVSQVIKNKGSDTMVNLAQAWAEKYEDVSSTASVEVSGGGSGTGVAALINGTVDIANCSRSNQTKRVRTRDAKHG